MNMLPAQFQEKQHKVIHDMSNPALFMQQSFNDLLCDIANQAHGITINKEITQPVRNPHTSPKLHPQCTNLKCPAPIGYMIATCWHDGGDDPGRKKRYQEKQKLKQTARANMAMTETDE